MGKPAIPRFEYYVIRAMVITSGHLKLFSMERVSANCGMARLGNSIKHSLAARIASCGSKPVQFAHTEAGTYPFTQIEPPWLAVGLFYILFALKSYIRVEPGPTRFGSVSESSHT